MRVVDVMRFAGGAVAAARTRSGMLVLAMAVGVTSVLLLSWVAESARRYVGEQFAALGTHTIIVLPGRSETTGGAPPLLAETPRDLTLDDALALLRSAHVDRIAPVVVGTAQVAHGTLDREATVLGTTPALLAIHHLEVVRGRPWPAGDPRRSAAVCLLGTEIANELFPTTQALGAWVRIGERRFRVAGVLGSTGRSLSLDVDDMALVPVASAQALFDAPGLFRVLVEARSRASIAPAVADVKRILTARHQGEQDVTVITQDAVLATFDRVLKALSWTLAAIASISLVVAGILVMNVMVVAVSQRREEIGLLRALGAPKHTVAVLFVVEAALLSGCGAAAGLAAGTAIARAAAAFDDRLAATPPLWAAIAAATVAILAGVVFGVAPARRAAALRPTEALARR